jgi:hypothetical protein
MSEDERAALRALAMAATPSQWKRSADCVLCEFDHMLAKCKSRFDAAYIAAAHPAAILAMLDERDALIHDIERAQQTATELLSERDALAALLRDALMVMAEWSIASTSVPMNVTVLLPRIVQHLDSAALEAK